MSAYDPTSLEGVPEAGRGRLEQNKRGLFTSDLSVAEFLLVKEAGFEPLGMVVGSSIYHIGFQQSAWNQNQGAAGQTLVKFTIQRDGSIQNVAVERGSGTTPLDIAAMRAVLQTKSLPPLPDAFPNPTLTVHLNFQYQ